jgi:hypothetical protein
MVTNNKKSTGTTKNGKVSQAIKKGGCGCGKKTNK